MGSAAMDGSGNIAVGYNVSSSATFPGLRYAGRLASEIGDLNVIQSAATFVDQRLQIASLDVFHDEVVDFVFPLDFLIHIVRPDDVGVVE